MTKQTKQAALFMLGGCIGGIGMLCYVAGEMERNPYIGVSLSQLGEDPERFNQSKVMVEGLFIPHAPGDISLITPEYQLTLSGLYVYRRASPRKLGYYGHLTNAYLRHSPDAQRLRVFIPSRQELLSRYVRIRGQVVYSAEGMYVLNVHSLEGLR